MSHADLRMWKPVSLGIQHRSGMLGASFTVHGINDPVDINSAILMGACKRDVANRRLMETMMWIIQFPPPELTLERPFELKKSLSSSMSPKNEGT